MHLHEYQARELLMEYGIPFPLATAIDSAEKAKELVEEFKADRVIIKAQIHAGGRGNAGGVKILDNMEDLYQFTKGLLGSRLVTNQTDAKGLPVDQVLISEVVDVIDQEFYVGALIDRATEEVTFMFSTEGGVDIEKTASETPEKVFRLRADSFIGMPAFKVRDVAYQMGIPNDRINQFVSIVQNLYKAFVESDLSLVELNPLALCGDQGFMALDSKASVDSNALYRQPHLAEIHDKRQENEVELKADELGLNYVALDGNIGCMVNGAGLAMATMDIIKLYGAEPANFLDVGGGTTKDRVIEAFKLIFSDERVEGVLVNIFGGIVRCDMIAEAIIEAVKSIEIDQPIVVRLEGNRAEEGIALLKDSGVDLIPATGLEEAAKTIVNAVKARV